MKKARYYFIDGRTRPHKVSYYSDSGQRRAKFFASEGDALLYQAQLNEADNAPDLPENLSISVDERIAFAQIRTECRRLNATLDDALLCLRQSLPDYVASAHCAGQKFDAALTAFLTDCERRGARMTSIRFYKTLVGLFARRTGVQDVAKITQDCAERYLAGVKSPEHSKRALRAFFNFCVAKKWVEKNPFLSVKTPRLLRERTNAEIISVDDCKKFLEALPIAWQPAAALMAFAGVRPSEIVSPDLAPVLTVGNVDFKNKRISVPALVSKTRRLRVMSSLPDNLWQWLEPLKSRAETDHIAPSSYTVWRRAKLRTGVVLPKDVLRHSFASYGYHHLGAELTVEIMGHVGGFGVFAKHYKGLATADDAKRYFAIVPKKRRR